MWSLVNNTPFAAERAWDRDRDGVHEWIVAIKGTFSIRPDGSVAIADKQMEPLLLPEYLAEDGTSSLRYDADVVASKPTTDILINGTAYAPGGAPSNEFLVSATVGPVRKVIKVVGNSVWRRGGAGWYPSAMEPVASVPIVYERAFGGQDLSNPDPRRRRIDYRNPVGCGLVRGESRPLPNLGFPHGGMEKNGPAGFGALCSFWSPRRELSGTYDDTWKRDRLPRLPIDWDQRSLLCSPTDQQPVQHLRGGERVELRNLTPNGILCFSLPRIFLRFRTRIDGRTIEHQGRLATVVLEPDHKRIIMVWQSSLTIRTNVDYLDETIVSEKMLLR